ncbi:MAG TPA: hypothetical protein PKW55_04780 [Spirochaetota bacterium]|nr:hypothetical protein [Spirochaetota bacterium]HOM37734.1 hypothetical protein [Spirochaetota bacterium]HPQ49692.1 hypothetical protein [Spirochaetota bacterium]
MKKIIFFTVILPLFIFGNDILKISNILSKIDDYNKNKSFKGYISLTVDNVNRKGYFIYQYPDKLKIYFGPESVKDEDKDKYSFIVTNGEILWVYLPQYMVLIEQVIPEYFKRVGFIQGDIKKLVLGYNKIDLKYEKDIYILSIEEPKVNSPFYKVIFNITSEGLIIRAYYTIKTDNRFINISIEKYNIKPYEPEQNDFVVKPTGDMQVLRNVLFSYKK